MDPQSKGSALLLTTNTEVSIAPKPHKPTKAKSGSEAAVDPSPQTGNASPAKIPGHPDSVDLVLRVLPNTTYGKVEFPEGGGSEILAYIGCNAFQKELLIAKDESIEKFSEALLQRLPPPIDPSSTSKEPESEPQSQNLSLTGGKTKGEEQDAGNSGIRVHFSYHEGVAMNHIMFSGLPDGVEEWDLVK